MIVLADLRFYGIKAVPKDDPIYQRGWSISFVPPSQQGTQKPLKKTLTQLLKEHGIKDAPADDPIYRERFSISLRGPSKPPIQKQPGQSETGGPLEPPQTKLIDRNSREPENRAKFLYWLAAMAVAFRAPQAIVVARVREVARSAKQDGVNWQDVYGLAKLS